MQLHHRINSLRKRCAREDLILMMQQQLERRMEAVRKVELGIQNARDTIERLKIIPESIGDLLV